MFKLEKRKHTGDHGESAFLSVMQRLLMGGILIGNIDCQQMLSTQGKSLADEDKIDKSYIMPRQLANAVESSIYLFFKIVFYAYHLF